MHREIENFLIVSFYYLHLKFLKQISLYNYILSLLQIIDNDFSSYDILNEIKNFIDKYDIAIINDYYVLTNEKLLTEKISSMLDDNTFENYSNIFKKILIKIAMRHFAYSLSDVDNSYSKENILCFGESIKIILDELKSNKDVVWCNEIQYSKMEEHNFTL